MKWTAKLYEPLCPKDSRLATVPKTCALTFPVVVLTSRAVESSEPVMTSDPSLLAARQLTEPLWAGDMDEVVTHSFRFHTRTHPSS